MRQLLLSGLIVFLFCPLPAQNLITIGTTTVMADTILSGLDVPWELEYGSDGHLWFTERKGLFSRVDPITKTKTQILDITSKVFAYAESGLLGFAFHPDFSQTPEIFLAYNYGSLQGVWERIVKFKYQGGLLINEEILIDSIKGGAGHNGARFLFLPDNSLLVTLGDAQQAHLSQDLNSLNGKIIRLNPDGTIPSDNPVAGSYVYSWGHRNPQGLANGPSSNVYTSEHGATTSDEFQLLEKKRNYGWPNVEGTCDTPQENNFCQQNNVKEPLREWTPTLAVGDLVWYKNPQFPEFNNCMLMATLKDKSLVAIRMDAAGTSYISESVHLKNMFGRLRAICTGPSGEIYLATNGANPANTDAGTHSIIRLTPPADATGMPGVTGSDNFSMYPNPAHNMLEIKVNGTQKLKMMSSSGVVVLQQEISGSARIDLSMHHPGVYILEIGEGKILTRKRIVKF